MAAKTVAGADGRSWSVRCNIEWSTPAVGDEFEHDVDGGRGAAIMILSALVLFWVILVVWKPSLVVVPFYLWFVAALAILFFPFRWYLRRPWTIVAETEGSYEAGLPAEHWSGMVRGRSRAKEEMRVVARSLRTRATPGHADSPLQPVN
ncbi:hypothetical protein ACFQ34_10730 [Pseudonocardia benzenivorans]|jgi:hypothetical protein|uniref:Uncharacterized protein n=2 Tax=Pseudonocardia TaxID=1847 RepID=F4CIM8_PSEUX|nr:hypothetical protein [Pseudonocardia dioxanivorans]AEA22425.1 hypothetical protein Psed_0149 [Pseudonocardia dioxanivorans CB1190]GJF02213.1 hypothetical protein PSD17_11770 [Pseudonocardia sp. D17]